MNEHRCGTEEERKKNCLLFAGQQCRDCDWNAWYSTPEAWVCLNCCKTRGKSDSEKAMFKWKGEE